MNRELYEFHGETRPAVATMSAVGAWFLVLPPYSPDLNPIEIILAFTRTNGVHALTFAKLKALIRRAASRTCEALWYADRQGCDPFSDEDCCDPPEPPDMKPLRCNAL